MNKKAQTRKYFVGLTIFAILLGGCNFPFVSKPAPVQPIVQPSFTPLPTYTSLPTYTTLPTFTSPAGMPTATLTSLPGLPTAQISPPAFQSPQPPGAPTSLPGYGVLVRIRNWTGFDINLYRQGRSGELHFLGWLAHGYYGEYRFPSLGEWVIRYCLRDNEGNSWNCKRKVLNVEEEGKEYSVP